jgi:microcin C transport system permease protein
MSLPHYLLRRLLLVFPTLFGILLLNFLIVQAAPGGPVEQMLAKARHGAAMAGATSSIDGRAADTVAGSTVYRGQQGIEQELIAELKQQYGFDQPLPVRFMRMVGQYLRFDFGKSFYQDRRVADILLSKLPVSISLGLWTTLLVYLISIPLGIRKAVKEGSHFDVWSSTIIIIGYAIPSFLFAMLLVMLFAGGSYWQWFPLRGLMSEDWETLSWGQKIVDYFWHLTLPVAAMVVGGFASLTILTKNSFLEEIRKQYVRTAMAKGASSKRVLYGHLFRNAMLIVIAGFPAAFIGIFFTGALLIEVIFSLDGLGLLGFEAAVGRDYPIVFATLYLFTLIGLVLNVLTDLMYVWVDPRIDFESSSLS